MNSLLRVTGLALLASLSSVALGQNLLENPNFDQNLNAWLVDVGPGSAVWSGQDAANDPASGSIYMTNLSGPNQGVVVEQCVPVVSGETYWFSAWAMAPSSTGQPIANKVAVAIRWYNDPTCISSIGGSISQGPVPTQFDTWTLSGPTSRIAPPGAFGVKFRLLVSNYPQGGNGTAGWFDALLMVPEKIFADGFESTL